VCPRNWLVSIVRRAMLPPPSSQDELAERREQKAGQEARDQRRYLALVKLGELPVLAADAVKGYAGRSDGDWDAHMVEVA
jgi:hypothetical protein